jgi:hypothetical protein
MQLRCQSEVARLRTMAPASMPWTAVQGLARDCQKLRYAQPHVASRPDPQQRLSPRASARCGFVWMVCLRSRYAEDRLDVPTSSPSSMPLDRGSSGMLRQAFIPRGVARNSLPSIPSYPAGWPG